MESKSAQRCIESREKPVIVCLKALICCRGNRFLSNVGIYRLILSIRCEIKEKQFEIILSVCVNTCVGRIHRLVGANASFWPSGGPQQRSHGLCLHEFRCHHQPQHQLGQHCWSSVVLLDFDKIEKFEYFTSFLELVKKI